MQFGEWVRIAILLIDMVESMICMREGKCCLVMHVGSAVYTLLSQLPILSYVSLSLLLSLFFPFKLTVSNFLGYWALFVLLIPLLMIVVCSSHIHGYYSFYTQYQSQMIFLFCLCFPPTIFVYYRQSARSSNIQVGFSHYLLAVGSGFSPTTCLATNFFPFLGKSQSGHNTTIYLFLLTTNPY